MIDFNVNRLTFVGCSLKLFILFVIILVFVLIIGRFYKKLHRSITNEDVWPYYVRRPLGAAEQVLYHRLVNALPDHIVLAQVSASRILNVKPSHDFNEWNKRIHQLNYDFVVCKKNFNVVAVIELDDVKHHFFSQQDIDNLKNKLCKDAGLRLIRWHVKLLPDEASIQAAFSEPRIVKNDPSTIAHDDHFDQLLSSV